MKKYRLKGFWALLLCAPLWAMYDGDGERSSPILLQPVRQSWMGTVDDMLLAPAVSRENSTLTSGSSPSSGGIIVYIPPGFVSASSSDASTFSYRSPGTDLMSDTSRKSLTPSSRAIVEELLSIDELPAKVHLSLPGTDDMQVQSEEPQEVPPKGCWHRFWSWLCSSSKNSLIPPSS